jgi:hypothetical protein
MKTMKMTKVTNALILLLLAGSLFLSTGCRDNSTSPEMNNIGSSQDREADSQSAAEIQATVLGTDAGGLGMNFDDSYSLMETGEISGVVAGGKASPAHVKHKHYDHKTKKHIIIIYRENDHDGYHYGCDFAYEYIFFDASGMPMEKNIKGVTDRIDILYSKGYSRSKGGRIEITDSADGFWSITNILSGVPILVGDYERVGSLTFTRRNGDVLNYSHLYTIEFQNDTLVRRNSGKGRYSYLLGPAESHFEATRPDGTVLTRDTKITFNGDGTALLEVTQPDGTVVVYLVDVKAGAWLKRV